ncbi:MAG TPA: hypothetical protein VLH10_24900, partial [Yinghuangia sp.]|nr:hypothetical protein [Yinghuangia sp.]
TWVVVAGALLLGVIGSDTGASDGSAATAARTSASPRATEPPTAVVRAPGGLPVRGEPRPDAAQLSRLADGSWVVVACHTAGPPVVGRTGTSAVWVRVAPTEGAAGFVPDAMLSTQGDIRARVPAC